MFFGVFGVFVGVFGVFVGVFGVFWRIWCFALRTCFLFGVLGVWFGVFGILSSLKMCRFLLINFAESSLYCFFCGKKYTTAGGAVGTNMRYVRICSSKLVKD